MTAPFIVRSVSRIHPGKADAYRPVVAEFCRLAQEREPRLLGFHIYVTEDGSSEVVVQIHPDAESMQHKHHIDVMGEKVRETFAYADFESLKIYGEPNEELKAWIPRMAEGIRFTHHPVHWGGFTRLCVLPFSPARAADSLIRRLSGRGSGENSGGWNGRRGRLCGSGRA